MRFTERVALVTGAANGIGRATALLLAGEGAHVVAADVDRAGLESLRGAGCEVVVTDVLRPDDVASLAASIFARSQRIDILVNAVGGSTVLEHPGAPMSELSIDDWQRVLDYNLRGTVLCTNAVVPHMIARRYGRIVNLSSIVARGDDAAARTNVAYVSAKAAIRALTRKLAVELGPFGITCNATAPGLTLTERIEERVMKRRTDEDRAALLQEIPLRRFALPEDQARVIAFLASDDAAFVSGQTIEVTGGQ